MITGERLLCAQPGSASCPPATWPLARVIGAHGLHGELKVEAYSDFPDRFAPGVMLYLGEDAGEGDQVTSVRPHKGNLLSSARRNRRPQRRPKMCRGLWFYVPEAEAAQLEEGAYWIHDIIGLQVVTTEGVQVGHASPM